MNDEKITCQGPERPKGQDHLAIASVPMQPRDSKMYSTSDSLAQGTLFPTLNLPFRLAPNGEVLPVTPLTELQALDFVLLELGLYLDTHADDKEAFKLFQQYTSMVKEGRRIYEEKYGPLTLSMASNGSFYRWVHGPWPWEKGEEL